MMTVWRSDLDLSVFRRRQKGMREEIFHGRTDILWKQALVDEVEELRVDSTEVAESLWLLFS